MQRKAKVQGPLSVKPPLAHTHSPCQLLLQAPVWSWLHSQSVLWGEGASVPQHVGDRGGIPLSELRRSPQRHLREVNGNGKRQQIHFYF